MVVMVFFSTHYQNSRDDQQWPWWSSDTGGLWGGKPMSVEQEEQDLADMHQGGLLSTIMAQAASLEARSSWTAMPLTVTAYRYIIVHDLQLWAMGPPCLLFPFFQGCLNSLEKRCGNLFSFLVSFFSFFLFWFCLFLQTVMMQLWLLWV